MLYPHKNLLLALTASGALLGAPHATAQALCASDGQTPPSTLVERFINSDCAACWAAAPHRAEAKNALFIDWIVPASAGEDAALSAAATSDALVRLAALGKAVPMADDSVRTAVANPSPAGTLRVAHGLALNGYVGTSISFSPTKSARAAGPLQAWLVLVETVAADTQGSAVERNLVRNLLQLDWTAPQALQKPQALQMLQYKELRPMAVHSNTNPARLRLVGWVQNAQGQVLAAAQSQCAPQEQ